MAQIEKMIAKTFMDIATGLKLAPSEQDQRSL